MKILILGGGVTGLTAAYELVKQNCEVLLLEKEKFIGGALASTYKNNYYIEDIYHHVFSNDAELFELLKNLKLFDKLEWKEAKTSFYSKRKFFGLSSPKDLFFFKMLNIIDKIKLAKLFLKIKLIRNYKKYDLVSAKDFIIKNASKRVYSLIFDPLLKSKFGENRAKISAAWLIARLSLRGNRKTEGEVLGYLKGGFWQLVKKLESEIIKNKGNILTSINILNIDSKNKKIKTNKGIFKYDKLLSTIPPLQLQKFLKLKDKNVIEKINNIKYQSSLSILLSLKNRISSFYWTNIMDDLIFGALVEHTNYIPKEEYNNEHLIYLASYHDLNSSIWKEEDEVIFEKYFKDLNKIKKINKKDINWFKIVKYPFAGVIYEKGFLKNLLPIEIPNKDIFIGGMFNSYPERSVNKSIELGRNLAKFVLKKE